MDAGPLDGGLALPYLADFAHGFHLFLHFGMIVRMRIIEAGDEARRPASITRVPAPLYDISFCLSSWTARSSL
jgi:hypothetical protein